MFTYKIFHLLRKPLSKMARKRRMTLFLKLMKPLPTTRILDLGGQPTLWDLVDSPLNITCLNLPGSLKQDYQSHHCIRYIEGDACSMPYLQSGDFDLVFSNSVIEHLGEQGEKSQFASEILRLSNRYWIQTPSKFFPIEAHCGMPFWWFYPKALRSYFLNKWRIKSPWWTKMVETTSVIDANELRDLLPGCKLKYEWFLGFPKSLVAYSVE